jgi:pimeloyl-ACP methyl ester carboxylesterase
MSKTTLTARAESPVEIVLPPADDLLHLCLRCFDPPETAAGIVLAGGFGPGFDSPRATRVGPAAPNPDRLYDWLAADLRERGVASVHVKYRHPADLDRAVEDVMRGLAFLRKRAGESNLRRVALVGFSFGGAVVLRAAVEEESRGNPIATVVTLSSQRLATECVGRLRAPLLAVHGTGDRVLPAENSAAIVAEARTETRLVMVPDAGHRLSEVLSETGGEAGPDRQVGEFARECGASVFRIVRDWLAERLLAREYEIPLTPRAA